MELLPKKLLKPTKMIMDKNNCTINAIYLKYTSFFFLIFFVEACGNLHKYSKSMLWQIRHLTNYGQKAYFWTFWTFLHRGKSKNDTKPVSAGRRDLRVWADSAGRRE
jgi:hypothetical protein